ncbi:MAG: iron-containing alcohol dehydrogenase, partial [Chloroflexota bacterium]
MKKNDPIYIGENATDHLLNYLNEHGLKQLTLVADDNTYAALGEQVDKALRAQDFDVTTIVLTGEEVIAGDPYLVQVLAKAPVADHTFIAVGGGTITDITRFISHRTKNNFISMPTATSVDGFTSIGAPLVLDGVKQTLISQPPLAVFADLPTLQNAPQRLIASGFGDMVGKYTSLAD